MKAKVVAILETRTGTHLAELIARRGGTPMLAPALEEVPDVDPAVVGELVTHWEADPFVAVIFQTGVGTQGLFAATDLLNVTATLTALLARSTVVARGPKPVGVLNARQIRIDIRAPTPFTTETILSSMADMPVSGTRILVQRYGAANRQLREGLEARGARVEEIATYRWGLPADLAPVIEFLEALAAQRVDAVLFTSAVQIHNLHAIAEKTGHAADLAQRLNRCVVASVGPVCSRALREYGVSPTVEANPPKLGPLIAAVEEALRAG